MINLRFEFVHQNIFVSLVIGCKCVPSLDDPVTVFPHLNSIINTEATKFDLVVKSVTVNPGSSLEIESPYAADHRTFGYGEEDFKLRFLPYYMGVTDMYIVPKQGQTINPLGSNVFPKH